MLGIAPLDPTYPKTSSSNAEKNARPNQPHSSTDI